VVGDELAAGIGDVAGGEFLMKSSFSSIGITHSTVAKARNRKPVAVTFDFFAFCLPPKSIDELLLLLFRIFHFPSQRKI
jgi:hypothetical protein